MYIAPGQGQTSPWGTKFWCQQKFLITLPICCQFKNNLFEVWFFTIFYVVFSHVYSPRQGQATHWGRKVYENRKAFFLCPYVASFKMISSKSDFIHIFNDFIHVYSSGARAENPWGQTFDVNRKPLSPRPFVASFKQISLNSDFIHIFYVFPYVYSPRAGADNPLWTKFWCQQKGLVTLPICCKFQNDLFEIWFYTHF